MDSFLFGGGVVFAIVAVVVPLILLFESPPKVGPSQGHRGKDWNTIFVATAFFVVLSAAFFAVDAYSKRPTRLVSPPASVQSVEYPTATPKVQYRATAEEQTKLEVACEAAKTKVAAILLLSGFRDISVSHKCGINGSGASQVHVTVRLLTKGANDLYAGGKLRKETYPVIEGLYRTVLREKGFEKPQVDVMTDFKHLF